LGDLFVILYFGVIAVATSFFILTGSWNSASVWLGLQVGLLSSVLIALNNLRDRPEDAKVGKRTLAVLFGDRFVQTEITLFLLSSYVFVVAWSVLYNDFLFLLYLATLPLAAKLLKTVNRFQARTELVGALGKAAALHVLFGISFLLASFL
jgi:1,4-dihydroxy-2-naphthoate octaprenyltransferase